MTEAGPNAPIAVVMGKLPQPGRVKTRLCPPLTPDEAAAVHDLFLRHTLQRLTINLGPIFHAVVLCYDPPEALPNTHKLHQNPTQTPHQIHPLRTLPQSAGNLGDRLCAAAADLGKDHPLLFLGCDSPDLPDAHLADAVDQLRQGAHIVLGPCDDGGFWCLGVGAGVDLRPIVDGVDWSSGRELEQTLNNAGTIGLSVATAPPWSDVDHPADLATLWVRVSRNDTPSARYLASGLALAIGETTQGMLFADGPHPDRDHP